MNMEILNNFWNMVTTENENMITAISVILSPIEVYFSFCAFTQILKIDYTKSQRNIYVIAFWLFGALNTIFIPNPYNVILNYIFILLLIKYVFKLTILKTILALIIPLLIFGLTNSLILNPSLKLLKLTYEIAYTIPVYRFVYWIIAYTLAFIILFILKHINFKIPINIDLTKKIKRTIFINLILGILTLFIQAIINFYYINSVPVIFTLFNFGLLFAYFFFSIMKSI